MGNDQKDTIAFLSEPASYGAGVSKVERHDTHASIAFLAGAFAYKVKRAVKYPYLDYSTIERRKEMCERDLVVNRRAAPQIYQDARPVIRGTDGRLRFGFRNEAGQAIDWVVVMQRFDQECLVGNLCAAGRFTIEMARKLGQVVADFHLTAEQTRDRGGASAIARVLDENASILAGSVAVERSKADRLDQEARTAFSRLEALLDNRRTKGFVRRCHGDLHLDNICVLDGAPVLIDAIEFNDDFACIDVLFDLAFPIMELGRRGLRAHANALLNRYIECTGDYDGLAALPLFMCCRAGIRAHVALARGEIDGGPGGSDLHDAGALLDSAVGALDDGTPRLVAVGGVSGAGKSTLAYGLAPLLEPPPGAIVLRSDLTRKALLGVSETTRLPAEAYIPAMHARVFSAMAEHALTVLGAGMSVILDGVYGEADDRHNIAGLALKAGVGFDGLWLQAPNGTLKQRVGSRQEDASDATVAVLQRQLETITAPEDWIVLDAGRSPAEVLDAGGKALAATLIP
jgi:aminoglycoside phosphotransferase family enzyme/predicted kinase